MENDLFRNKYRIPSVRAYWHDYNCGYYFITICTEKREHYFGEIYDNKMIFSELGVFAEAHIDKLNSRYDDAKILSHIIMPNHIHLIVAIYKQEKKTTVNIKKNNNTEVNETMSAIAKERGRLSLIISKYKSSVTRFAIKNDIPFIWQTRFYDRIIRDSNEYAKIDNYIKSNVSNWKDDEYYPTIPL